jgi:hypothetical protein
VLPATNPNPFGWLNHLTAPSMMTPGAPLPAATVATEAMAAEEAEELGG